METAEKITQLENEIKVLKNEVQAVLLDIRENFLNAENPFSTPKNVITSQQTVIERQIQTSTPPAEKEPEAVPSRPLQEDKPAIEIAAAAEPHNGGPVELEISQEDFTGMERGEMMTSPGQMREINTGKPQLDLVAYAALASWVEDSTKRLGRERTEAVLDMSEAAGHLPSNIKTILVRLLDIKQDERSSKPTSRDYLDSLVKISAVLGNKNDSSSALLLVLSQGDGRG